MIPASRSRCPRCFAELDHFPPLEPADIAQRLAAYDEAARREAARRFRPPRRRTVVFAIAALLVGLLTFKVWDTWFRPPSHVALPSTPSLAVAAGPEAWPVANGDLGGTRATTAPAHLDGGVAWRVDLGAPVVAGITTDGRVLVAALADGRVRALSATDGSTLWELSLPNAPWSAPTIAGDLVLVAERSGRLAAYDLATGTQHWAVQTGTNIATPVLVAGGVAYVYGQSGMFAFDAATGGAVVDGARPTALGGGRAGAGRRLPRDHHQRRPARLRPAVRPAELLPSLHARAAVRREHGRRRGLRDLMAARRCV